MDTVVTSEDIVFAYETGYKAGLHAGRIEGAERMRVAAARAVVRRAYDEGADVPRKQAMLEASATIVAVSAPRRCGASVTAEELAEIEARVDRCYLERLPADVRTLLAEVRRLRAIEAAARDRDGCDEQCAVMAPYRGCTCGHEALQAALDAKA